MKKRVLAVLLAVCMIVGMGALAASAAEGEPTTIVADGNYAYISEYKKITDWDNIKPANLSQKTELNTITIKEKNDASISMILLKEGTFNEAQAKDFFDVSPSSAWSKLSVTSCKIEEKDGKTTISAKFELTTEAKDETVYKADGKITSESSAREIESALKENDVSYNKLVYKSSDGTSTDITDNGKTLNSIAPSVAESIYSLEMALRFNGDSYNNLSASEIAEITASYTTQYVENNITKTKDVKVNVNKISDLREGTEVILTTNLKAGVDSGEYGFSCWVNSKGNVLGRGNTYKWIAGSSTDGVSPIYAVYTELKDRVRINYSATGDGTIGYQEKDSKDKVVKRGILESDDGQISVLEGHEVTFVFKPAEGCEVAHVYVNLDASNEAGRRDVASFGSLLRGGSVSFALRQLVKATNTTEGETAQYTFTSNELTDLPQKIRSIEVVFAKKTPIEAPTGLDMPTVAAEGLTLATGAAAENGSNAANGNGDSNGAATTVPAENGAAGNGGSAVSGVVNPATGSTGAVAVFAVLSVAAGAAFVTAKKKED